MAHKRTKTDVRLTWPRDNHRVGTKVSLPNAEARDLVRRGLARYAEEDTPAEPTEVRPGKIDSAPQPGGVDDEMADEAREE